LRFSESGLVFHSFRSAMTGINLTVYTPSSCYSALALTQKPTASLP
jgi:hypothetical protein